MAGGPTLYDRLGVEATAELAELRRAYRTKALEHHPDRSQEPGAEESLGVTEGSVVWVSIKATEVDLEPR